MEDDSDLLSALRLQDVTVSLFFRDVVATTQA